MFAIADTIAALSGASALAGAAIAFIPLKRHFEEERRQSQRIEDAIMGVEATGTLPAIPSIFTVVTELAQSVNEIKDLTRQLKPNGGSSLADEIRRSAHKLDKVQEQLDAYRTEFVAHLEAHTNETRRKEVTSASPARQVSERVRKDPAGMRGRSQEKGE